MQTTYMPVTGLGQGLPSLHSCAIPTPPPVGKQKYIPGLHGAGMPTAVGAREDSS